MQLALIFSLTQGASLAGSFPPRLLLGLSQEQELGRALGRALSWHWAGKGRAPTPGAPSPSPRAAPRVLHRVPGGAEAEQHCPTLVGCVTGILVTLQGLLAVVPRAVTLTAALAFPGTPQIASASRNLLHTCGVALLSSPSITPAAPPKTDVAINWFVTWSWTFLNDCGGISNIS